MLTSEGARVNPEWLKGFLANPALSTTDTDRDGVRSYLQVRMPTFYFSDDEIRSLVLVLRGHVASGPALHPAEARAAHHSRKRHGARPFHQHRRALPEVPLPRRSGARQERHGAQLPAGQGSSASRLDRSLDHQPAAHRSGHGHAVGACSVAWTITGSSPARCRASFNSYKGDHADLLVRYMFQLTPEEQRALVGRTPKSAPGAN